MAQKILIIEDNSDLAKVIKTNLEDLSFEVSLAYDGASGLDKAEKTDYDLIILDLMLPGLDGIEICRRVRTKPNYSPILMLTSKSSEFDRILGLEIGADDYVTKPFSMKELMARVKAIFRRIANVQSNYSKEQKVIHIGGLVINPLKRSVTCDDASVDLTAKEFDLLLLFASNPGRVYTRLQLLDIVWGYGLAAKGIGAVEGNIE